MNTIHDWDLNPSPLQAFRQGNKSVELRLFDEKRRQLKLGDLIRFKSTENPNDTLLVQVVGLTRFPSFKEVYAAYRPEEIGYPAGSRPDYHDMEAYYSPERIAQYGAYAIAVRLVAEQTGSPLLFSDRLVLRPFQPDDAAAMFSRWCHNDNVSKWCTWNSHQAQQETESFLQFQISRYPAAHAWGITVDGRLIGSIDETKLYPDGGFELGYVLSEAYWGKGYMSEAFHQVLLYYFNTLKAPICHMSALVDNSRSRHVIENQGFLFAGFSSLTLPKKGNQVVSLATYSLSRAQFFSKFPQP